MSLGIDQSGLEAKRRENLAQAAPMVSFFICSNARISLRREAVWDAEENERQKSSLSSSQSWIVRLTLWVYHCSAFPTGEKGNNFHLKVSYDMHGITKHEHSSSNTCKWRSGSSIFKPEKVCARTMAMTRGWSLKPGVVKGLEEVDGSENSSSEVESWWIEEDDMI